MLKKIWCGGGEGRLGRESRRARCGGLFAPWLLQRECSCVV